MSFLSRNTCDISALDIFVLFSYVVTKLTFIVNKLFMYSTSSIYNTVLADSKSFAINIGDNCENQT